MNEAQILRVNKLKLGIQCKILLRLGIKITNCNVIVRNWVMKFRLGMEWWVYGQSINFNAFSWLIFEPIQPIERNSTISYNTS